MKQQETLRLATVNEAFREEMERRRSRRLLGGSAGCNSGEGESKERQTLATCVHNVGLLRQQTSIERNRTSILALIPPQDERALGRSRHIPLGGI